MKSIVWVYQIIGASIVFEFFGLSFFVLLILSYFLFAIIDVITGYYKNESSKRTSARLSNGITTRTIKFILLTIFYILISHALTLTPDGSYYEMCIGAIPLVAAFARNLSELKSIAENLKEMGANDPIITGLPSFIDRVFKLGDEVVGKLLDKFAKSLSDRIEKKG